MTTLVDPIINIAKRNIITVRAEKINVEYNPMSEASDTTEALHGAAMFDVLGVAVESNVGGSAIAASEDGNHVDTSEQNEEDEKEGDIKYYAQDAIDLFVPVSLCMLVVIATINTTSSSTEVNVNLLYTPFHEFSSNYGVKFWNALANSFFLIGAVAIMTTILIILYKKRCYKIIYGWLILSSLVILFILSYLYLNELLRAYNIPMDYATTLLIMWNFGVAGMVVIHWQGPLILQQSYLSFLAALMALVFIKYLPDWTAWAVLATISIWDLFAVLSTKGPIRILLESAQQRNEQIFPGLIYSCTARYEYLSLDSSVLTNASVSNNRYISGAQSCVIPMATLLPTSATGISAPVLTTLEKLVIPGKEVEASSANQGPIPLEAAATRSGSAQFESNQFDLQKVHDLKLGLGDFIFYSVLVGKASKFGDWTITITCFVVILIGISLTLLLLAYLQKSLPALPISIAFGLIFCLAINTVVKPLMENLTIQQIFI